MLLDVKNIHVTYKTNLGNVKAIEDVTFTLSEGERLGIVGESGCGKTTLAKALIRLLPSHADIPHGSIFYKGADLVSKSEERLRKLRWKEIAFIPQSAMNALNPVYRVKDQIMEAILTHTSLSKKEALQRVKDVFGLVGLDQQRLDSYPHQLSGGMKQRVIIAMALSLDPPLIIADEPTTALDVIVQDKILKQMISIQNSRRTSMIIISHDIAVIAQTCHTMLIMYGGKVMEKCTTSQFLTEAYHPYTLGLQHAYPSIYDSKELISIPGSPPDLLQPPPGCRFQERCPFATSKCLTVEPKLITVQPGHQVACHYPDQVDTFRQKAKQNATWRDNGGIQHEADLATY